MGILSLRYWSVLVFILVFCPTGRAGDGARPSEKDGKLVVIVTWGDVDNTPATDVFIEVHGYVFNDPSQKSIPLKASHDGQYEASLQPALYDVFVSEGGSVPRCRRLQVKAGLTTYWTLKLEIDDVYTDTSRAKP